ncbi:MAG: dTMP kinase [Candidatus Pacebacteria bacterium]|nr:dTMP kinase [Candidatus Paceibacterota bacterium]
MTKGKFIVLEGIDGSGKATQTKLLIKYFKKKGLKVQKIDFPQHGTKSAAMVDEYLKGKYGKIDAYKASVFYAIDRYDASFKIRKWLKQGNIVVADRYISSNAGHQGGKLDKQERKKYFKWLYNLEYNIFEIPKPDLTIILKSSPQISFKMSAQAKDRKKVYLGKKKDLHEKDINHLKKALQAYLDLAKTAPREFKVIECIENNKMISLEKVHEKIKKIL